MSVPLPFCLLLDQVKLSIEVQVQNAIQQTAVHTGHMGFRLNQDGNIPHSSHPQLSIMGFTLKFSEHHREALLIKIIKEFFIFSSMASCLQIYQTAFLVHCLFQGENIPLLHTGRIKMKHNCQLHIRSLMHSYYRKESVESDIQEQGGTSEYPQTETAELSRVHILRHCKFGRLLLPFNWIGV